MAQMNTHRYRSAGERRLRVGNNRTTQVSHPDNLRLNKLHQSTIMEVRPTADGKQITLDTCGHRSSTTRQAMQDFLGVETGGIWGVSFAKGRFKVSCKVFDIDVDSDADTVGFTI